LIARQRRRRWRVGLRRRRVAPPRWRIGRRRGRRSGSSLGSATRRQSSAAFVDDLFEPAVEARQRIGDPIVVAFVAARSNFGVAQRHAFDLTREIVKTIVHRREVVAERILVVAVRFAIWSGSLPHAIPSLADAKTQETAGPLEPAPTHENWRLARSEVRAQT